SKLNAFTNVPLNEADSLREMVNTEREQVLRTAYTKPVHTLSSEDEKEQKKSSLQSIFFAVQIPTTIILSLVSYILTSSGIILALSFIFHLLELVYLLFIRRPGLKTEESVEVLKPEEPNQIQNINLDSTNNQLFINLAWKKAYQGELNKIDQ